MAARCHDRLFKPGFPLDKVAPVAVGALGDEACAFCDALLYADEVKAGPHGKRGRYCCAEGQVELPPAKKQATVDGLWRDDGADGKLHGKAGFNRWVRVVGENEKAAALEKEVATFLEQEGWQVETDEADAAEWESDGD